MHASAFSARAIVAALWTFLVDVDSGLFVMLRRLCFTPGKLVATQLAKQTQAFREPLRLFVFANVIFLLVESQVGLFPTSLESLERSNAAYAELALEQQQVLELSREVYAERFNNQLDFRKPIFAGVLVLLLALFAKLFDPRRPLGVHIMFALYALSWILLSWPLLLFGVDVGMRMAGRYDPEFAGLLKLILLTTTTAQWFARAQFGGYQRSVLASCTQAVLLTGAWLAVKLLYAQLLFWLTWAVLGHASGAVNPLDGIG